MQIVVGGCMAQKDKETIQERAGWVDVVFGTHNTHRVVDLLDHAAEWGPVTEIWDETVSIDDIPSSLPSHRESPHSAWVTITIGCNNSCTFCIVPIVRGAEISRRPGDVLREVGQLAASGVIEVTLLGQNVNSYGRDLELERPQAIVRRPAAPGRGGRGDPPHPLHEPPPEGLPGGRCRWRWPRRRRCASSSTCPCSRAADRILAAMHRGYDAERFLAKLEMARGFIPDLSVSTDIIVGFPGETEEDFAATMDVVREARFDGAFTFQFSPRPGTPAATLEGQIVSRGRSGALRPAGDSAEPDLAREERGDGRLAWSR